jgi:hypothetical protein
MFRATMRPSSGETTVFMRHLVLAPFIQDSHPHNNKYQVRINTVVSPDDGRTVARNI